MEMYISGLARRADAGLPIDSVASVASFFVSRVDTKVDGYLMGMVDRGGPRAEKAAQFLGQAAIANARLAYNDFKTIFGSERFAALKAQGGRVQRPLWASTGTKNPAYRDVVYIEELVGKDTVNTIPPATLAAFLDHGVVRAGSLEEDLPGAHQAMARLEALGISMANVTAELEAEGVKSFASAWKALMDAMEASRKAAVGEE
jgi:transaldolase